VRSPSRTLRFLRRSWDTVGLALVVVGALAATLPLSRIAGAIPRGVLLVTLVLVCIQLVIEFREVGPAGAGPERLRLPPMRPTGPIVVALWVAGLMLGVLLFGTILGSALFCLAYLRMHARESWWSSAAVAVTLAAVVYLVFAVLLRAQLHYGLLTRLAR
jgi:hypothetical protein